jgi:hypothetical protein
VGKYRVSRSVDFPGAVEVGLYVTGDVLGGRMTKPDPILEALKMLITSVENYFLNTSPHRERSLARAVDTARERLRDAEKTPN